MSSRADAAMPARHCPQRGRFGQVNDTARWPSVRTIASIAPPILRRASAKATLRCSAEERDGRALGFEGDRDRGWVLSENRAEGLVRPVYQVDGRPGSQGAPAIFKRPLPGGYSSAEDGPSGPVSRR